MSAKDLNGSANGSNMRRFLRRRTSREYFKKGGWTSNPEEAENFSDVVEAAQTCVRYDLVDVELAIRFGPRATEDIFCTPLR
jgi:hypothetical protein